jgi:hypothetical protein
MATLVRVANNNFQMKQLILIKYNGYNRVYEIYPRARVTLVLDETIIDNMIYNINRSYNGCITLEEHKIFSR